MDDTIPTEQIRTLGLTLGEAQAELARCRAQARRVAHDLGERVKELTCLYRVSSLLQHSLPVSEVMKEIVASLVPAYQFPEIARARITLDGQTYATPGFAETPWRQASQLTLDDTPLGVVEVFYGEERPEAGEGPFLTEERHLLDGIAGMLERYLHRRQVEEGLRQSENRYRTLIDHLYEGVWLIDGDHNTTFINRRMAEMLGYRVDEMLGKSALAFLDPRDHEAGRQHLALRRTGVPASFDFEFPHKNGSRIWTRIAATPLFDEQGRYQGALAGVMDISDRKRAEAALAEKEERFRRQAAELENIYWWTPIGLAVFDAELRFLRVNRRLAELNGVPAEAHIGRTLSEVAPAIARQAEWVHRRIMETGEPVLDVELHARTPAEAGCGLCWNAHWLPLKDPGGHVWGINVVVEEITERKRWEDDLYRREQEFEALAERSPDITARVDRDWRFLYINTAVEKLTGLERGWFVGKSLDDLPLDAKNKALRRRAVEDVFRTRLEQTLEHAFETPAGMRYFYARLVPELDRTGAVESVLVVDRDVTDLKRVQHALEELTLHDPLTGVANRRYLDQFIAREWRRGARHRYAIALIMADIDHFKPYNDQYGHPRGDDCLRQVAHALETHLHRPTDLLVRYGGEEFLVVLPETAYAEARRLADAMRQAVMEIALSHSASPVGPVVTASFGVVAAPANTCTFADLLARADQALYRAKQAGRNRVEGDDASVAP